MREIVRLSTESVKPEISEVLKLQGITKGAKLSFRIESIIKEAYRIFQEYSDPTFVIADISPDRCGSEIITQDHKDSVSVIEDVFKKGEKLALFALTLGKKISDKIDHLFKTGEFPLGSMLDSVASAGADKGASEGEKYFNKLINNGREEENRLTSLIYSPGYCGWKIDGQKNLFKYLKPEEIGISLRESLLMDPMKSVSGLIVSGRKEIHFIKSNYTFCRLCKTRSCKDRIKQLK
ncbi:MAG: vitamin B12 dependent-methionine synthase activation domain-containing protein [Acidobacteriota bacterium]